MSHGPLRYPEHRRPRAHGHRRPALPPSARGSLRQYSRNFNAFKSAYGLRQPVRIPHDVVAAARNFANPDDGLKAHPSGSGHVDIQWLTGADAADTSYPIAWSYDRWQRQGNILAPSLIDRHAVQQAYGYEQFWDSLAIAELKKNSAWGAAANMHSAITIADPAAITDGEVDNIIDALLTIPNTYWLRGMNLDNPENDDDAERGARIICVMNSAIAVRLAQRFKINLTVGQATSYSAFLQASLGDRLAGMTVRLSRAMDNTVSSAGDEFAAGTFLEGSLADVDDQSPMINEGGRNAAGDPTLEQRVGFWYDLGIKHLDPLECYAVPLAVT